MNLRLAWEVSGLLDKLRNLKSTHCSCFTSVYPIVSDLGWSSVAITQKLLLKFIQFVLINTATFVHILRITTLSCIWSGGYLIFREFLFPVFGVSRARRLPISIHWRSVLTRWSLHVVSSLGNQIICLPVYQINISASHLMFFTHVTHSLLINSQGMMTDT